MDGLTILQKLDSLWLFSNVLSSTSPSLASFGDSNENTIQNHFKDTPKSETLKPITPNLQIHQTQSPISKIVPQKCPKFGDLIVEVEEKKKEEKRKRKRNKKRLKISLGQKRRIVKALDFGFDVNSDLDSYINMCGFERIGDENDVKLMPPFSDGMAMKEHLKSWAYAVACTVK